MMDGAIAQIAAVGLQTTDAAAHIATQSPPAAGFQNWLTAEVQSLDRQLATSESAVKDLALGNAANLHDVMLKMEQARLSLQLAMQVRNRVVEAYQDVLRMQI